MFLLDGSDNTKNGFPEIKLFVKSIVESLSATDGQDRVSVVQFADNPEVSFYLNSHKTKNEIKNAIDNLSHKGGRRLNIGQALQFVRHSVFTSSTGSRRLEEVPQILILLSSKPSTDNVKSPAFALKEHGIVSVGIGVGDANSSELEMITSEPGFTYKVNNFSKLPSVQLELLSAMNMNKNTEETMTGISDLVGKNTTLKYYSQWHLSISNQHEFQNDPFWNGADDTFLLHEIYEICFIKYIVLCAFQKFYMCSSLLHLSQILHFYPILKIFCKVLPYIFSKKKDGSFAVLLEMALSEQQVICLFLLISFLG